MSEDDLMFTRIVVPLDGSDVAEQALAPAVELAGRMGIPLHLIRVTDLPHTNASAMFGYLGDCRMIAEQVQSEVTLALEYLAENVRSLTEQGLTVTSTVEIGLAARVIVAATNPGDCIVMASHGRSGLARWYIGSVAEQVMRQAAVPVMVIRSAGTDRTLSDVPQLAFAP